MQSNLEKIKGLKNLQIWLKDFYTVKNNQNNVVNTIKSNRSMKQNKDS